jgi:hypothetical protein
MAGRGFTYVKEKGFLSLIPDLKDGARWKDIPTPATPLYKHPFAVHAKGRVLAALNALLAARGVGTLDTADSAWDRVERRFYHTISAVAHGDDAKQRAAASRLLGDQAIFSGNGTAQTQLPAGEERDFGREQVLLLRGKYKDEVALLGVEASVSEIEEATEALSNAMGMGLGQGMLMGMPSRKDQTAAAVTECRQACNFALSGLTYALSQDLSPEERKEVEGLAAPFVALLERYPAPKGPDKDEDLEVTTELPE